MPENLDRRSTWSISSMYLYQTQLYADSESNYSRYSKLNLFPHPLYTAASSLVPVNQKQNIFYSCIIPTFYPRSYSIHLPYKKRQPSPVLYCATATAHTWNARYIHTLDWGLLNKNMALLTFYLTFHLYLHGIAATTTVIWLGNSITFHPVESETNLHYGIQQTS